MPTSTTMPTLDPPPCTVCNSPQVAHFTTADTRQYWRCKECYATFLEPHQWLAQDQEKATYDQHENSPQDPTYRTFLSRLTKPLVPKLMPGTLGLDYGCGPGPTLSVMLQEQGFRMCLYDPYFADNKRVLLNKYAFITCTEVAEHFYYPYREFCRLDKLLRSGGWLAVMTGFLNNDAAFIGWPYRRDPTHVVFYKPQTLIWIAHHFNWRIEFPCPNVALFQKAGKHPAQPLSAQ